MGFPQARGMFDLSLTILLDVRVYFSTVTRPSCTPFKGTRRVFGVVMRLLEAELFCVMPFVGTALAQHALHVRACLWERDVSGGVEAVRAAGRTHPPVDVVLARVVRRDGQHLVAVVAADQIAQVPGAVGDVDLGRTEVLQLEARAA